MRWAFILQQPVLLLHSKMRWQFVLFLLISSAVSGQDKADSIAVPPETHHLEGNPWNGTIISAMQNPAFAGFDRRLQLGYYYEGEKLKVPEGYDTKKAAFWNQTAIVDFAFGGKRNNIGVNVTYNSGQRLISDYHRLQVAHSYRLHFREHRFILGLGLRYLKLIGGATAATYGDQIDPRYGYVYPTQEFSGPDTIQFAEYAAGLIYYWRRLFFGYAFRHEHRSLLTAAGNDFHPVHHLNISYSVEFGASGQAAAAFTAQYDGSHWFLEPSLMVMYRNMLFAKVSSPNVNEFKIEAGLHIWHVRAVYSVSLYYSQYGNETYGVASMSGGLRYHLQPIKHKQP
jgi:hypothetical protein